MRCCRPASSFTTYLLWPWRVSPVPAQQNFSLVAAQPHFPIIQISSTACVSDKEWCLKIFAYEVISKPSCGAHSISQIPHRPSEQQPSCFISVCFCCGSRGATCERRSFFTALNFKLVSELTSASPSLTKAFHFRERMGPGPTCWHLKLMRSSMSMERWI